MQRLFFVALLIKFNYKKSSELKFKYLQDRGLYLLESYFFTSKKFDDDIINGIGIFALPD